MDAKIAPAALDARLPAVGRVAAPAPQSDQLTIAGAEAKTEIAAAAPSPKLLIEIDKASGRFINTLLDADGNKVIRQYPSDAQLAYSRAVTAYLKAMSIK